jgi:hypothetical protein
MLLQDSAPVAQRFAAAHLEAHSLNECRDAQEFSKRFEATTGRSVLQVTDEIVGATTARAVFLVGSLPLGMGSRSSDIDLIVLVDDKAAIQEPDRISNTQRRLAFSNESDPLRGGEFLTVFNGVMVDVTVVIASAITRISASLRRRGPELSEKEILTLGRLSTGWLLWQSDGYLERSALKLKDPAFDVYCCTKSYVSAVHLLQKGLKAIEVRDIPLILHLGRASVEAAYLAYFASEGLSYLGVKWLAQVGHAVGAADRVRKHRILKQGVSLLFPLYTADLSDATNYLEAVSEFLAALRSLIEQRTLFRIAFTACPQIQ